MNAETPIPFFLGSDMDPEAITVRGYGPAGGGVIPDAAARITNVDSAGGFQYLTAGAELMYPGLYLYVFSAPGSPGDSARFEVG